MPDVRSGGRLTPSPPARTLTRATLDNGLEVVVVSESRPLTALALWIETGAADETSDQVGIAHLLEHMVFKGTATYPTGAAARRIESLGGDLNAWTAHDETAFHATVLPAHWRASLEVISDLVRHGNATPEAFDAEQAVVLEEIASYANDPESVLDDAYQNALWGDHPYGRPVLGTRETVANHTPRDVAAYRRQHHQPSRARLLVIGDVPADAVIAAARHDLGDWAPSSAPNERVPLHPLPTTHARLHLRGPYAQRRVRLGWTLPPAGHCDLPVLEVVAAMLGQGAASWMSRRFQIEDQWVVDSWATLEIGRLGSSFTVGLTAHEGGDQPAVEALLRQTRLWGMSAPHAAVQRAQASLLADLAFEREAVDDVMQSLGLALDHHNTPDASRLWREQIAAVTPDRVREVLTSWLTPERVTIAALGPVADATLRPSLPSSTRTRPNQPSATTHTFANGARVVLLPDSGPVVGMRLALPGGDRRLSLNQGGLSQLWADALCLGAGQLPAIHFGDTLDRHGVHLFGVAGRWSLGVSASAPRESCLEALERLDDVIRAPHFEPEDVAHTRDELLEAAAGIADRPHDQLNAMFRHHAWGTTHPWSLPAGGTVQSLTPLDHRTVQQWHAEHAIGQGAIFTIAGGFDPREALQALSWLEDLPSEGPSRPPVQPLFQPGRRVESAGTSQATVLVSFQTPGHKAAVKPCMDVLLAHLNGQGGLLFLRLREALGLGYSTWAQHLSGEAYGVLSVGIACSPDRMDEAEREIHKTLASLAAHALTPEDLGRCVRSLQGGWASRQEQALHRATDRTLAMLRGYPTELDERVEQWAHVTPSHVQAMMAHLLSAPQFTLCLRPAS